VDFRLHFRLFHISLEYVDFFVCFFMDTHPQAVVVLFPCPPSQGFDKATMGFTLFHFILFLALQCIATEGVLNVQVSAGAEFGRAADVYVLYGRKW